MSETPTAEAWLSFQKEIREGGLISLRSQAALAPKELRPVLFAMANALASLEPDEEPWDGDKEDELTPAIKAAHPVRSGEHATFARALQLVGNRRSKSALVELVSYLLIREKRLRRALEGLEFMPDRWTKMRFACSECDRTKAEGHEATCSVGEALADLKDKT